MHCENKPKIAKHVTRLPKLYSLYRKLWPPLNTIVMAFFKLEIELMLFLRLSILRINSFR